MNDSEKENIEEVVNPWLLTTYYKRLFPTHVYCKWLAYGEPTNSQLFSNREFSFTRGNDIYCRHLSFTNHLEFEKELLRPPIASKIDIGAVFTIKVPSNQYQPTERELVFDIDLTDYDDVRFCCVLGSNSIQDNLLGFSEADICKKCWSLAKVAIKIIDKALQDDFGFEQRLWIYSGRRGVHCWVCDPQARELQPSGRSAIVEYLTLVTGGENTSKRVSFSQPLHSSIQRAKQFIQEMFIRYACVDQAFLDLLLKFDTSPQRWAAFNRYVENETKNTKSRYPSKYLSSIIDEIQFEYCYPRLDVNVTKGINHLLKSPFSIHPKTGRVCVPIDVTKIDSFDPFTVPELRTLCQQVDALGVTHQSTGIAQQDGKHRSKDYNQTSLKPYVELFSKFVQKTQMNNLEETLAKSDLKAMITGDI
ncbi:unnamed protein product [Didymodactylos carnosus]|uniref:DNA primase n=1 Tax=Didymodactylos carnosus TaxID=1234261 RepID=A0A814U5B3_9BILA|nr:unnamed protein product [Didymodactylos carnosus]CAF1242741.1 unnamed protein product [Didymodactylos carnosus]CAF3934918.1 unnamed protein product [Didymodactylos carnosus]CAF4050252.1 unnamed protein product [Didymodactylos carnosus]